MSILLDHKEIRRFSNTKNKINVLGCLEIDEVQDNVLLLKTKENSFLKEQVGNWRGKPVVKFNILVENVLHKDVLFVVEQGNETVLDYDALGIRNTPVATTIITESKIVDTVTPQIVTEQAKRVITDTVKQGKKHLTSVVKEAAGTASKLFKQNVDKISGNAIGELEIVKEDIINDINIKNKEIFNERVRELTNLYDEHSDAIIQDNLNKIEQNINQYINEAALRSTFLQETKQLALQRVDKVVEEAKAYTTSTEKMLKEYRSSAKRDIEDVKVKLLRVAESGGGTNAVQYANGGTMDGDLHVTGRITGNISLSSLTQDGAHVGDTVMWNGTNWVATTVKVVSAIGDNTNTEFLVTHNFNTFDVMVQVYDNITNAVVYPAIQGNTLNDTKINFSIVPDINNYRVVIKQ